MRIRLFGQRNNLGIGIHYANFCDHIRQIYGVTVEEIDVQDQSAVDRAVSNSLDSDINICFIGANIHEFFKGRIIQYIVFETDRVAEHILKILRFADAVWVPSTWGQEILTQHGIESTVMPEGVDPDLYNPYRFDDASRKFRFLTVGKFEGRKSIRETIQAFAAEFGNDSEVELYVKTGHYSDDPARIEELKQFCDSFNLDNLIVYWGSYEQMTDLYRDSDAFVFPTKGEAWGLPLIDAAASGLPIITVMHSGHTEYLQHILSSVMSVGFKMVPVDCPDFKQAYPGDCGNWAQVDIVQLGQSMRELYNNFKSYKERAVHNSDIIRTAFSWQNSVNRALKVLQKYNS